MKVADWIALGVLTAGIGVGGFVVYRHMQNSKGAATVAPLNPTQPILTPVQFQPTGAKVAPGAQPNQTITDIKAGVGLAGDVLKLGKGIFDAFNTGPESDADPYYEAYDDTVYW